MEKLIQHRNYNTCSRGNSRQKNGGSKSKEIPNGQEKSEICKVSVHPAKPRNEASNDRSKLHTR